MTTEPQHGRVQRSTDAKFASLSSVRQSDLIRPSRWWSHRTDCEVWAWCLAIMCVALLGMRQSFLLRGSGGLSPSQAAVLAALAIVVTGVVVHHDPVRRVPAPTVIVLCIVATALVASYAGVSSRGLTSFELQYTDPAFLAHVTGIGLALLIIISIRTPRAIVIALRGLSVAGAISAFYALLQTATGIDLAPAIRIPGLLKADTATLVTDLMRAGSVRPQGAAGHPLELSAVLTVLAPVATGVALHAYGRRDRWWPWALISLVIVGGALTTISRSAVVGLAVSVVVFACTSPIRRTVAFLGCAVSAVVVALVFQVPIVNQLYQVVVGGSDDNSLGSRAFGANYVGRHFVDHLWFGQGVGTYNVTVQPVLDNEYLSRLMEQGLVGLIGFAALLALGIGSAGTAAFRALRSGDRAMTDLASGVTASLAAFATVSSILDISGFKQISTLMFILVGLSVALAIQCRTSAAAGQGSRSTPSGR